VTDRVGARDPGGGRAAAEEPRGARPASTPQASRAPAPRGGGGTRGAAAPEPVAARAQEPAAAPRGAKRALDLAALTGHWDELVSRFRTSGKALVAAALEASAPSAINAAGDVTIKLDEPNDFHAKAIEQAKAEILAILSEWFDTVGSVGVFRDAPRETVEKPRRLTDEMVKSERLNGLRRKDALLDAAIDVLDLEIVE